VPCSVRNQIRRLRFEHGEMTQQQLAERAGVTRQTIVAIEGAKYAPSLELAFRIAAAFGVPLETVFQYDPRVGVSPPGDWTDSG
jgi:putative transcriptional regulator